METGRDSSIFQQRNIYCIIYNDLPTKLKIILKRMRLNDCEMEFNYSKDMGEIKLR